jgi:hypothetical protein
MSQQTNMNTFDNATKTVTGIETKDVKFNSIPGKYLGKVFYEGKFITVMWHKTGKCIDARYPQFNLAKPNN